MDEIFTSADQGHIKTRASSNKLLLPHRNKSSGCKAISHFGPKLWNKFQNDVKTVRTFKHKIKEHYFNELVKKHENIFMFY